MNLRQFARSRLDLPVIVALLSPGIMAPSQTSKAINDLYAVLGVDPGCSSVELQRAYKRMALKHHPDNTRSRISAIEALKSSEGPNLV